MTDIDLAWAAGVFEGEGTVMLSSSGHHDAVTGERMPYSRLVVVLASTDLEMVQFFQQRWPARVIRTYVPRTSRNARLAYEWRPAMVNALQFLWDIEPFVRSRRVREKIALALKFQATRRRGYGRNVAGYWERQRTMVADMREKNRRGAGIGNGAVLAITDKAEAR